MTCMVWGLYRLNDKQKRQQEKKKKVKGRRDVTEEIYAIRRLIKETLVQVCFSLENYKKAT